MKHNRILPATVLVAAAAAVLAVAVLTITRAETPPATDAPPAPDETTRERVERRPGRGEEGEQQGRVSGRVRGPGGRPFPGARVRSGGVSTETDDAGRFVLDGVSHGANEVVIWAPDHAVETRTAQGDGEFIEVRLRRVGTVKGRLRLPDGLSPAGAEVIVHLQRKEGFHVRANADGTYEATNVPSGMWYVTFPAQKVGERYFSRISKIVRGVAGPPVLEPPPGAPISGRVIDPDGRMLPGVLVEGYSPKRASGVLWHSVLTDAEGRFEVIVPADGKASLRVRAETDGQSALLFRTAVSYDVAAGTEGVEIQLAEGQEISGRLRGPEGAPARGVKLVFVAQGRSGGFHNPPNYAVTDGTGRFRAGGLHGEQFIGLPSEERGRLRWVLKHVQAVPADDVELQAAHAMMVCGSLVNEEGEPLGNLSVTLQRDGKSATHWHHVSKSGRFLIREMPPGDYEVLVRLGRNRVLTAGVVPARWDTDWTELVARPREKQ